MITSNSSGALVSRRARGAAPGACGRSRSLGAVVVDARRASPSCASRPTRRASRRARRRRARRRAARRPTRCRRSRSAAPGTRPGARTAISHRSASTVTSPSSTTHVPARGSNARTPESADVARPRSAARAARPSRARCRSPVGLEAEQQLQQQHRRAGGPGLRPRRGRVRDRERRLRARAARRTPRAAGSRSGAAASSIARTIRCASGQRAVPREAPRDQRVVVGPDGAVVVAERVVRRRRRVDIVRTPQPDQSSVAHQLRRRPRRRAPAGRCPLQSRWPMFEQSESTRSLVAVERERVVAAALVDPERLVEARAQLARPRARAARRAPGRARPRARARPCRRFAS